VNIPAHDPAMGTGFVPEVPSWPVEEKYGMIWLWTGKAPRHPIPYVPELKDREVEAMLGSRFAKNCHPNVVMINAIDAQHFNSVHPMVKKLAGNLHLEPVVINPNNIEFRNRTPVPRDGLIGRALFRFYKNALTYWMSYWYASTGSVTLGPDFLHFHIIFALRPTLDGRTEGQTILVTKRRAGILGKIVNAILLRLTAVVGNYFAKGDTLIFSLIQFKMRAPIKADHAIIRFVQHAEGQPVAQWGRG
jgi:phenylpropionate dioxygenase-like ring-hydroxylating dioxygenase large terminal subunit